MTQFFSNINEITPQDWNEYIQFSLFTKKGLQLSSITKDDIDEGDRLLYLLCSRKKQKSRYNEQYQIEKKH